VRERPFERGSDRAGREVEFVAKIGEWYSGVWKGQMATTDTTTDEAGLVG
jgi:hypothetical protein